MSYDSNLVECCNYKECKNKIPEIVAACHNGICMDCVIKMSNNETMHCDECSQGTMVLQMECEHKLCIYCYAKGNSNNLGSPVICIICKQK